MTKLLPIAAAFLAVSLFSFPAMSLEKPTVNSKELTAGVYLISGKGGNLTVSIGDDGTFLVDDKFAPMTEVIVEEIKKLGGDVPRFVLNTHWHGDHTGGNLNLNNKGSVIVAHNNVRKRLSQDTFMKAFKRKVPASPAAALPVVTFSSEITFHLNNTTLEITHIPPSHTDGDSVVFFKELNLLSTGDIFFNGFYPFIDTDHGGSLKGMVAAANTLLNMVDDKTIIVPGHGPVANKADLINYRDALQLAYNKLSTLKKAGKTLEQALAENPLAELDKEWSDGLFDTNKWISLLYDSI